MPFDKLNDSDLEEYGVSLQGADIVNEFGEIDLMLDSLSKAPFQGAMGALIEGKRSLDNFLTTHPEEDISTGKEMNALYAFEGEDEYEPDEVVLIDDAKLRHERSFERRMEATINEIAEGQGTMVTFSRLSGGLLGGFLDPVALFGGAAIGNALRAAPGILLSATKSSGLVRPYFSLFNSARKAVQTQSVTASSLEAMVGAAVLDVPAQMYLADKYKEDFSGKEVMLQVVGAGIFGAAFPLVGKTIRSSFLGLVEAQQTFKTTMLKKFGSDTEEALGETLAHVELADQLNAVPDETVMPRMQAIKAWKTREGQAGYTFSPALLNDDFQVMDFHVGRRSGEKRFREVADYGTGTTLLVDNENLAWNSVQDLNGKHSGEVKSVRVRDGRSILAPENFIEHKARIIRTFKEGMEKTIKSKKSGKDLTESIAALNRLESSMLAADNMADFHDAVATSAVSRHPEMHLNTAIKQNGFDGYHVLVPDPTNKDFANGLVLIDAVSAKDIQNGKTSHEMAEGVFDESDLAAQDGIVSYFDDDVLGAVDRKVVPKADLNSNDIKGLRKEMGEIQKTELARLNSPEAKIGYVEDLRTDSEINDVLQKEAVEDIIAAQDDAILALDARDDIPDGVLSEADRKFIADAKQRVQIADDLSGDMINCLNTKEP